MKLGEQEAFAKTCVKHCRELANHKAACKSLAMG